MGPIAVIVVFSRSLVLALSKRGDRIDSGRTPRWDQATGEGHGETKSDCGGKRKRIGRADARKQSLHGTSGGKGKRGSDNHTSRGQNQRALENHVEDHARAGS